MVVFGYLDGFCDHKGRSKRVSRRVGELASERARGQGSMQSTQRLNDMDPCPLVGYASGADATGHPRSW